MGLDISPGNVHFGYGSFSGWRWELAREEGVNLMDLDGYGGNKSWDDIDTPLKPLLYHSDCDGFIAPWDLEWMLPRLREIAAKWDDELNMKLLGPPTEDTDRLEYNWLKTTQFIESAEHCVEHGCAMVFA